MVTRAQRDAVRDQYVQVLDMAEILADYIEETAHSYPSSVVSRQAALAALESAGDVCSRLRRIVGDIHEMPVEH